MRHLKGRRVEISLTDAHGWRDRAPGAREVPGVHRTRTADHTQRTALCTPRKIHTCPSICRRRLICWTFVWYFWSMRIWSSTDW